MTRHLDKLHVLETSLPFVATFNDPTLAPFNVYILSRAAEYIQDHNDVIYRDWFLENRIHVIVPRTYAAQPPITLLVTAANSAVLGFKLC